MKANHRFQYKPSGEDEWIINVGYFPEVGNFVASSSSGSLYQYSLEHLTSQPTRTVKQAHESSINSLKVIDRDTFTSSATDCVKLWDLRVPNPLVGKLTNPKSSNFLSIDYHNNLIAGGTELQGTDAAVYIWDTRRTCEVVKSYIDSHHDDVTDIKFHPTLPQYLMSGSTDGCVIIFDMREEEEDDALHQVVNFDSIHSCNFISEKRISILSHVETFSIYELNNTDYESAVEPQPKDFGDLRNVWSDCEYVVDLNPSGYVSFGANSKNSLTLYPFNPNTEKFGIDKAIELPNAHGEEIVRDLFVVPSTKSAITCGEDGVINLWELPYQLENFLLTDVDDSETDVQKRAAKPIDRQDDEKAKEKRQKKKEKKHKKYKKEKRGETRFKPY